LIQPPIFVSHEAGLSRNTMKHLIFNGTHIESIVTGFVPFPVQTKFGCNLTQLRLYLEDRLLRYAAEGKRAQVGIRSDQCWCAWQHYLSGVIEDYNKRFLEDTVAYPRVPDGAVDALASGWNPNGPRPELVPGKSFLDSWGTLDRTRGPVLWAVRNHGLPPKNSALPAQFVADHFKSAAPGTVLCLKELSLQSNGLPKWPEPGHKVKVSVLDDGQVKTQIYAAWFQHCSDLDQLISLIAPALWARWLRDSVLGTPLRDVEFKNETLNALGLLPKIMEKACPPREEHLHGIFSAVLHAQWPPVVLDILFELPQMKGQEEKVKYALQHLTEAEQCDPRLSRLKAELM
jgi:hypothetical protein